MHVGVIDGTGAPGRSDQTVVIRDGRIEAVGSAGDVHVPSLYEVDRIRDGHTFVPLPETRIEAGDELLIVTTSKTRAAAESRLRAVSRRGKLAYWFDEYGEPD